MLKAVACSVISLGLLVPSLATEQGTRIVVKRSCDELSAEILEVEEPEGGDGCTRLVIAHLRSASLKGSQPHQLNAAQAASMAAGSIRIRPGWPRTFFQQIPQTVAVADFGNEGGLATVLHEKEGTAHALAPDGRELEGWPVALLRPGTSTLPATFDLDQDGYDEVILGMRDMNVLSGKGELLPGWPFEVPNSGFANLAVLGVRFFPGQAMRIAAGASRAHVHLFQLDGVPVEGWPVVMPPDQVPNPRVGNLAVGDITGDGVPEIVATERSESRLFVYDSLGNVIPPFPVRVGRVMQEVTLGDLDQDGALEIVFQTDRTSLGNPGVIITRGDGTPLPGWPQPTGPVGNWGVALGDVDGDGRLEVLASTVNGGVDFAGGVHLWNDDGSVVPGWPKFFKDISFPNPVTMGDVDGDGVGDVIVGGLTAVIPSDGVIFAWKGNGDLIPGFPIIIPGRPLGFSAPTITDLDGDGNADLGVMALPGILATFPGTVYWFDLGVPYRPEGMEWPTRAHDMARTGAYKPPVRRMGMEVTISPPVVNAAHPAPALTAVFTPSAADEAVPTLFRLVKVDGIRVDEIEGIPVGQGIGRSSRAARLVFRFDGEAVRALLGGPGPHRLLFRSDVIGGVGGIQFEAEATLTIKGS